jgi:DNA-binding transcriptional regulator YdaS (Cro superfamily)
MLIVETAHNFIHCGVKAAKDPWATNRWLAAELARIGYGAQSELARRLDLPASAVSNMVKCERKISAAELATIQDFVDEKLSTPSARPTARARRQSTIDKVRVVGYVTAGGTEHRLPLPAGDLDEVAAPADVTDKTVAVQIRGSSLGELFDRWFAFYDDVRSPITPDLIGELCVVGTSDGRVMIKKVALGTKPGHYKLLSAGEKPLRDVRVEWAAKVKSITPR